LAGRLGKPAAKLVIAMTAALNVILPMIADLPHLDYVTANSIGFDWHHSGRGRRHHHLARHQIAIRPGQEQTTNINFEWQDARNG
jgi:hypothetical protein